MRCCRAEQAVMEEDGQTAPEVVAEGLLPGGAARQQWDNSSGGSGAGGGRAGPSAGGY